MARAAFEGGWYRIAGALACGALGAACSEEVILQPGLSNAPTSDAASTGGADSEDVAVDGGPRAGDATAGCAKPSDCPPGQRCLGGACRAEIACSGDKACAAVAAVCSAKLGVCVACQSGADCATDHACKANTCLSKPAACASTKACAVGQVCAKATGLCVECEVASDCAAPYICVDTLCAPDPVPPCTPGVHECHSPIALLTCTASGAKVIEDCPPGQVCVGGACQPPICPAGVKVCQGTDVLPCNDTGTAWRPAVDCPGDATCVDGDCVDLQCSPGAKSCSQSGVATCDAAGQSVTVTPCPPGFACAAKPEPACLKKICQPKALGCQDKDVVQCDETGTSTAFKLACGAGQVCNAGACAKEVCKSGQAFCDGAKAMQCSATGAAKFLVKDCGQAGDTCSNGLCAKTPLCTAKATTCENGVQKTCKGDGSGWIEAGCDDGNPCTTDGCAAGACVHLPVADNTPCGGGSACIGGACKVVCGFGKILAKKNSAIKLTTGFDIAALPDGGALVVGGDGNQGGGDAIGFRLDALGNAIWKGSWGGAKYDVIKRVVPGANGFVLFGETDSYGKGARDVWVMSIDAAGKQIADTTIGTVAYDSLAAVAPRANGGFAVLSIAQGAPPPAAQLAMVDAVLKVQVAGAWDPGKFVPASAIELSDGSLALAGQGMTTTGFVGEVARISATGQPMWSADAGPTNLFALAQGDTDLFAVGGVPGTAGSDNKVVRVDLTGKLVWQKSPGAAGESEDLRAVVAVGPAKALVAAGQRVVKDTGQWQGTVIAFNPNGTLVDEAVIATASAKASTYFYAIAAVPGGGAVWIAGMDGEHPQTGALGFQYLTAWKVCVP